jgi:CBS domain-containing protein
MQLSDILTLKGGGVISLPPEATAAEAVATMVDKDMGSVVILDRRRLAGVLTFREVLKAVHERGADFAFTPLKDIMDTRLIVGHPDDSIDRVREIMTEHHVRYLPVMDAARLLGIISFHDVAKAALNEAQFENRLLKRYIEEQPEIDPSA